MTARAHYSFWLKLASRSALAVALLLIALKTWAWLASGSVSLLAGLTDSLMDGLASLLNLIAIQIALKPADREHRFGHGKAEALAGLAQAAFITGSSLLVALQAFDRLLHPKSLPATDLAIAVIIVSLVLTLALVSLQRVAYQRTQSTAIAADALHYRSDILLNLGILLALWGSTQGWVWIDPIAGLSIAAYILFSAWSIVRQSVRVLMDEELDDAIRQHILTLANNTPGVFGAHDLRTRAAGPDWFVQLHLELAGDINLEQAHRQCDAVEAAIKAAYPQAQVILHADPPSATVNKRPTDGACQK